MKSEMTMSKQRTLQTVIPSLAASDGAGVKLRRSLGSRPELRLDPFLMLDEFFSDDPNDYLAGFPDHPHRGFETVTLMLDGHMRHEDSNGNRGDLGPGDAQWMSAASGIVHSEMPQQSNGRMRGFQLWINLPASEKMNPPSYRDLSAGEIPAAALAGGGRVRVIAGEFAAGSVRVVGPIAPRTTQPLLLDFDLRGDESVEVPVPEGHNAFIYVYDGDVRVGDELRAVPNRAAGVLSGGDSVRLRAGTDGARLLLLAGKPLREPVVQHGPFVMNTRAEIEQAIVDFSSGNFARRRAQAARAG
jgi:quercetin 2,3-dioxygenase